MCLLKYIKPCFTHNHTNYSFSPNLEVERQHEGPIQQVACLSKYSPLYRGITRGDHTLFPTKLFHHHIPGICDPPFIPPPTVPASYSPKKIRGEKEVAENYEFSSNATLPCLKSVLDSQNDSLKIHALTPYLKLASFRRLGAIQPFHHYIKRGGKFK